MLRATLPCATLVLLAACSGSDKAADSATTFDTLPSGTVVVTNTAPSGWTDSSGAWTLVLEHTIQPPEGDPAAFGDPFDILLRPDGSFLLRESDEATLTHYGPDGSVIRRFGRKGGGPGEFAQPYPAWMGDTLVVHDPSQARITLFALDGTVLTTFPSVCCHMGPATGTDTRGRVRVTGQRVSDSAFAQQWIWFDLAGKRVDSLVPPKAGEQKYWQLDVNGGSSRYSVPFAAQNSYGFLADGSIVYGFTDRYELLITRTGADTARIIRREGVVGEPVPEAVVDSIIAQRVKYAPALAQIAKKSDVPAVQSLWTAISVDGAGNLWVHRDDREGGRPRFDVFDPEGRFLGEVASPFTKLWAASWAGDRVGVLDEDEAGLPRVRVYRIER
jgi:hypothetical protein